MKKADVLALAREQLIPAFRTEVAEYDAIDMIVRGKTRLLSIPARAGREKRELGKMAESPWLRLVVRTATQMLRVEGCYSASRDTSDSWAVWERNRFTRRQVPLHEAAIQYGTAYAIGLRGPDGAVLTPFSPREFTAFYRDASDDEWPMYGLREIAQPNGTAHYVVLDEQSYYRLGMDSAGIHFIEETRHDLGFCPVVRYSPMLDLEGRAEGDVSPYVSTARRICKTTYDRLLVQHFNSWRVRTATKIDQDATDEDVERMRMKLAQDDVLVGEGDTEFGTLAESPLAGFNESHEADIEDLAAVSQTPTTALSGRMINVSAEGLAEAKASAYSKRDESQITLGASHAQLLRLGALIEGRREDAEDYTLRMSWADTETRTMAQTVDALGKAAQMLGVPPAVLWPMIPGVDISQARAWEAYADEHPTPEMVQALAVAEQMRSTVDDG